jgi:hypothetical protein
MVQEKSGLGTQQQTLLSRLVPQRGWSGRVIINRKIKCVNVKTAHHHVSVDVIVKEVIYGRL